MAYTTIVNAIVEWDDNEPLYFTISEKTGSKDNSRLNSYQFDLTSLRKGFEEEFLLNLKNVIIERRQRVALVTIKTEYGNLILLLRKVIDHELFYTKRANVDDSFLLAINTIKDELSKACLDTLKRTFSSNQHSPLFAMGLQEEDFPTKSDIKGEYGKRIDNILAKALSRSACVEILWRCEEAYEDRVIDISLFSFINLAFSVYVRPDSYRRIRLDDLVSDTDKDAIFLYIPSAKDRVQNPQKICYRINKNAGLLLLKQRQNVIDKFGHLVDKNIIGELALFPSRGLKRDKSGWVSKHANENFGQMGSGAKFSNAYFRRIQTQVLNSTKGLNGNSLRHTVGTQLAEAGCSAKTIQAVLKHAIDKTCMAYVDIAFHGLINVLSDALQPAFETHLPVFKRFRSKDDLVAPKKAIYSEDIEAGRFELIGECGVQIRCQAAPFTCYECNKFVPCYDADHSLNIETIQGDIDKYKNAGTPYLTLVEKAKAIKYRIQLVMAICDRHKQITDEQKDGHEQSH